MMHFRRETNLQDAPREIAVFCRHLPPLYCSLGPISGIGDFGGEINSPPSPIIAGLEAILNFHTLRHFCCAERFLLYPARGRFFVDGDNLLGQVLNDDLFVDEETGEVRRTTQSVDTSLLDVGIHDD